MKRPWLLALLMIGAISLSCTTTATPVARPDKQPAATPASSSGAALTGAGATFPFPIYSKWFDAYDKLTSVKINYQSIGSGGGIKQITERTVDFGASDAPISDEQLASIKGEVLHIPTVLGAVVIIYNLPGSPEGLKLTAEALSRIFLGEITKWNDPQIASANPDLQLPDRAIAVIHRSDGSGTTNILTDYLSTVSPGWKARVGKGTAVRWPVGIGGKGNEGVSGQVKQIPASIGYVELAYAVQNRLRIALIRNKAGNFIEPTIEATSAAAASARVPEDLRFSIVDPEGDASYPIGGATWILVYREQTNPGKGKALVDFLQWALADGERMARDLHYAPLPEELAVRALAKVKLITYQGRSIAGD